MTIGTELDAALAQVAALQAQVAALPQAAPAFDPSGLQAQIDAINTQLAPIVAWFNAPETPPAPPTEADIETGFGDLDTILKTAPPTLVAAIQKVLTDLAGLGLTLPSTTPVPSPAVTPPTWTTIAQQHGPFTLNSATTVRYGEIATNRFFTKALAAGNYTCDNAQFGDPAPGIDAKVCQVQS